MQKGMLRDRQHTSQGSSD